MDGIILKLENTCTHCLITITLFVITMANGWVYSSVLAAVILILVLTQIFVDFEYEISSTKGIYVKITPTNLKLDNTTFENADFEFKDSFCTINTTAGYIPVFSAHLDNITE